MAQYNVVISYACDVDSPEEAIALALAAIPDGAGYYEVFPDFNGPALREGEVSEILIKEPVA